MNNRLAKAVALITCLYTCSGCSLFAVFSGAAASAKSAEYPSVSNERESLYQKLKTLSDKCKELEAKVRALESHAAKVSR